MTKAQQRLYLAADHGGWQKKNRLAKDLQRLGYDVVDLSETRPNPRDDYPRWAIRASRLVQRHPKHRAILVCRTGVGMAMAANKVRGVRAVQGWSARVARQSRRDEDTNVLSLAADYHPTPALATIARTWLRTPFRPAARHLRRLRQVKAMDHGR